MSFVFGNIFITKDNLITARLFVQGSPSMVKGVGFRSLSFRGSWVQIPPPAPVRNNGTLKMPNAYL